MESNIISINGIWCLQGDTYITNDIRRTQTLKWDKTFEKVLSLIGPGNGRIMVDVGAYIGDSTKWFEDAGFKCYAFEPMPDAFECLKHNASLDTICFMDAIGSGETYTISKEIEGNLGGRSLDIGSLDDITTIRLDDQFPQGIESPIKIDVLKIDAEGFEPFILRGAKEIIKQKPVLIIEINREALAKYGETPESLLSMLDGYDFEEVYRYNEGQYDLVCLPRNAKPVLVCLGRFGDVYQVCKAAPQPSIIFTSQAFVSIVKQLFPQHEVFVYKDAQASYGQAIKIAETRFPDSDIQPAQQYHMPMEVRSEFRNYQVYQEWQAGKRDFSFQPMKFPMSKVKKAIIHLGGVSSPVTDPVMVRRNLYQGLRALGLEVEEYEQQDDFIKAVEYFNQPQTLYIINDTLEYHLCDRSPVIILSRSMQCAQSSPKRNCIGRLTHEQLATDYSELLVLINRASTMRPFADHMPARTYLVFSEYLPGNSDAFKRNGWAQASWGNATEFDYHIELVPYESEGLPRVNEMLKAGMEGCEHPDDLVIILNRDICLTPEAVGMIRAFMDSRDIDACYLHHVNVKFESLLRYSDIKDMQHDWGVDAFVFRPGSEKANVLMKTPLWLGRTDWDNYWASVVGVRFPYNVIYHYPHTGDWKSNNPVVAAQNTENQRNIMKVVQPSYYDRSRFDRIGPTC